MTNPERLLTLPANGPMLSIVGPTATGKSSFAIEVALALKGEIVSCDSMAVYRGLDIGTDKPSHEARQMVPSHLFDVAEPGSIFSAGAFRTMALRTLEGIWSRGRIAVLVGGTGLYYRALTRGLVSIPGRNEAIRRRLKRRIELHGPEKLHGLLCRFDPDSAATIGKRDALRIVRALEVFLSTGKPLSTWIKAEPFGVSSLDGLRVGLTARRSHLYALIERRVDDMMKKGLLEEVRKLDAKGLLKGPAAKAIGYGELAAHLKGSLGLEEAVDQIKLRSRRLAKRQLAWFGKEEGIKWFNIEEEVWKNDARRYIENRFSKTGGKPGSQHSEPDSQLHP